MFSLKQLTVFDAVARLGNVSEAADELAMTQPAASMSLQQLESALGAELFVRVRKRLVLSERGKLLQPMARSLLVESREIMTAMNSETHNEQIRVGASPTVGGYLLNEICTEFMHKHPQVRLSISVLPAFDVISRVDEMALDVGLIEFITVRPTLEMTRWREEALVVFCAPEHPLAARTGRLKAADLQGQKWCLQHRFSDTRRQFTLALLQRIPSIDIVLESDSLNILQQAVMENIGMGCLPRPCIAQALASGHLVELPIKDLALGFPITIVTRQSVRKTTQHEDFVQTVLGH
jgi:DNA-binding transcriptional LysR family regulator